MKLQIRYLPSPLSSYDPFILNLVLTVMITDVLSAESETSQASLPFVLVVFQHTYDLCRNAHRHEEYGHIYRLVISTMSRKAMVKTRPGACVVNLLPVCARDGHKKEREQEPNIGPVLSSA